METRTTTFGYGNKTDIINREGVPPPGAYDSKSSFMLNRAKKSGYTFSNDKREVFSREYDLENPGPGKYDRVYNNYSHLSYSLRSKYEDPLEKHKNVPNESFSPWDLDNITAPLLSTTLGLTSTPNIEDHCVGK